VCPGDLHTRGIGQVAQAASGGMTVHPGAAAVEQDRPTGAAADRPVDGRPTAGGSGIWTTLVPLPQTRSTRWPCSSPRSVISAPVASKIRKPSRPRMATRAKALRSGDWRAAVSRASNCRWVNPRWVILGAPRAADVLSR
jgi:hypothetical protein